MERAGMYTILAGIVIAMVGSIPFVMTVITDVATPNAFAGNLMWQAWVLGGVVAFVGMMLAMMGDRGTQHRFPT